MRRASSAARFSKSGGVAQEHVALAAGGAVEFDDDRPVDLGTALELARQAQARARQPLALQFARRFPVEHGLVPEVRDPHLLVLVEREVRDERAVRDDDDLAPLQLGDERHEVLVALDLDHFVDEGVRAVQSLHRAVRDRQRVKALVVGSLEDLQGRV